MIGIILYYKDTCQWLSDGDRVCYNESTMHAAVCEERKTDDLKLKWGDFIIFVLIGLLVGGMVVWGASMPDDINRVAQVLVDGQLVYEIRLDELTTAQDYHLDAGHIHLIAEPGRIRFIDSDCRDRVCIHTGWLDRPGKIAACLPFRTLVKIVGEDNEVDVVLQ